ncbi:hypothetical protein, partial [Streptococcus ferus]|uniref:hypothetical protein n=1 Tax=Streptococcus ferus TaxID=1345 RepID=UPI0035A09A50
RDTTISINSIIFWSFLVPVYSIFMYLFLLVNKNDGEFSYIWLISPLFWLAVLIWIILLNRIYLVNKLFIFLIGFTSSILNYYISKVMFTGDLTDIEPNASNLSWQLYTFIFLFLASLIQIVYNNENYSLKRRNYIKHKVTLYQRKYKLINNLEGDSKCLVLAILIKEDFERPPILRFFEIIFKRTTRYIAQNNSQSDWHSVYILIKNVIKYKQIYFENYPMEKTRNILREINNSNDYIEDVCNIYYTIQNME